MILALQSGTKHKTQKEARMMKGARTTLVLLLLGLMGCATTPLHFTSEPSGASVSMRETSLWYLLWGEQEWIPKGTTPCAVSIRASGPNPVAFLLSLSTNQTRIVELEPRQRRAYSVLSYPLFVGGVGSLATAGAVGAPVGGVLFGVGAIGLGLWMGEQYYFPQTDIHVDFNSTDRRPSQTSNAISEPASSAGSSVHQH